MVVFILNSPHLVEGERKMSGKVAANTVHVKYRKINRSDLKYDDKVTS